MRFAKTERYELSCALDEAVQASMTTKEWNAFIKNNSNKWENKTEELLDMIEDYLNGPEVK